MSFRGSSGHALERNTSRSGSTSSSSGNAKEEASYKLVMIGDSGVGKSCILEKLMDVSSQNTFISTIGVDIKNHTLKTDDGRSIKLQVGHSIRYQSIFGRIHHLFLLIQVWDTGGQQRYRPVLSTCYRNAVGIIVVFDVTNKKSFDNLGQWMAEVSEFSSSLGKKEATPKLLLGNKCDLSDRREVDYDTANKFAKDKDMIYLETSAVQATSTIRDGFLRLLRPRLESHSSTLSQS